MLFVSNSATYSSLASWREVTRVLYWLHDLPSLARRLAPESHNKVDARRSLFVFCSVNPGEGNVCVSEGIVSPRHDHTVTLPQAIRTNAEIIPHVKGVDDNVIVMNWGEVFAGDTMIFPGLAGIA